MTNRVNVAPSARRLTKSLRDVGYSFESAVADLVDNSITAGAHKIEIQIQFAGKDSTVTIQDDGLGMGPELLNEALRFGSRRDYGTGDLGRYGLGLKTASLSQCRRIEVYSKTTETEVEGRALDLDFIEAVDNWFVTDVSDSFSELQKQCDLALSNGTVVVWKNLDRILPAKSPEGGWARRRIEALPHRLGKYLSMVFHRFLAGETGDVLTISINGEDLEAWDPFARSEAHTHELSPDAFEIESAKGSGTVELRRFMLPTRENFSSHESYEQFSGPEKWNRQQGLYIYRANRLVQWGGWAGIRTADEHTKFARASLDFDTDLDEAFNINVAKMRVSIPGELRKMISRPVNELCMKADSEYRKSDSSKRESPQNDEDTPQFAGSAESGATIGLTLRAAAARTGNLNALNTIMSLISKETPELTKFLGFD